MSQFCVILYIGILLIGQCSMEICKKCHIPAKDQIKIYERFVTKSKNWNKRDQNLIKTWNEEFQLMQINLTTEYRIKVKELSFNINKFNDTVGLYCGNVYKNEISKDKEGYYVKESECLKAGNIINNQELETGTQLEKEIKKWRKSFKYLKNLCKIQMEADKNFEMCLVHYVRRDKFDLVFKRLRSMKNDFMRNIISKQNTTLSVFEDCLEKNYINYFNKVHKLKTDLNVCYKKKEFQ